MPRLIDIDDLVDLDVVYIRVAGVNYRMPGDLPVPDYLRLRRDFNDLVSDEPDEDIDRDELLTRVSDQLLEMLQQHQPDLAALPCGVKGVVPIAFAFLNGLGEDVEELPGEETVPPTRRRASTPKKRSGARRSTTKTPATR